MNVRSHREVLLIVQTSIAMFAVAGAFGFMRMRQLGVTGREPTIVVISLPVSATLLYALAAFLVPNLLATRRLGFPLNVTLPVVFAAMTMASVSLWTTTGSALFQVPEVLRLAQLWSQPVTVVVVAAAQCLTLTALGLIERKAHVSGRGTEQSPV